MMAKAPATPTESRPDWFLRTLAHVDELEANPDRAVGRLGHLIHKLKAKDSTGRWAYYFVLVRADREARFLKAIQGDGTIDLEDYGKVVESCYGEEPTQEVRDRLRQRYGFEV